MNNKSMITSPYMEFLINQAFLNERAVVLRRFSLKKLRISEGIFVILLMALSFE